MSSSDTSFFRWRWMLLTLVLSLSLLPACDRGKGGGKDKAAAPAGPPPAVVVTPILQKTVPIYYEFVARTDSPNTVEIRARVQAYLEKQHFEEGTMVKKGQILFTLDKREYEAALEKVKAQLAQAEADLAFATDNAQVDTAKANLGVAVAKLAKADNDEKRLKPLADRQAVPQQDYDTAVTSQQGARADVESRRTALETSKVSQKNNIAQARAAIDAANAAIIQAELNLGYCTIQSPIDGLIGERKVAPGNLVGRTDATLLDTVSSVNPIRAYLALSEADYLNFMALRKSGKTRAGEDIEMVLANGSVFPHKGRVIIADRAVDEKTGTLSLIAEFANPDGLLRPGQFGRVRLAGRTAENAILVPQRAVTELQDAKAVYVVGLDNKVAMRTVEVADRFESFFIIKSGVKAGERVIVEGVQKVRPGMVVQPTEQPAKSEKANEPKKG